MYIYINLQKSAQQKKIHLTKKIKKTKSNITKEK